VHSTVVPERDLPGDPDFWIRSAGPADAIEGYAGQVSVRPDQPFTLHVSTTGSWFRVSAYRIDDGFGYPHRGAGGEQRREAVVVACHGGVGVSTG
jgi:hypothetical protein